MSGASERGATQFRNRNRRPRHTALSAKSWEYRLLQKTRDELSRHLGGNPSATQRVLIERAAWLTVYIAKQDAQTQAGGAFMSEHASRQYLAWSNSLVRTMKALGLRGVERRPPSLAEIAAAAANGATNACL